MFATSRELIAIAGLDGEVELWTASGKKLAKTDAGARIRHLALTADGALLVGAGDGDWFFAWDTAALAPRHVVEAHAEWMAILALGPDGLLVTAGANDCRVRTWQLRGDPAPHAPAVVAGLAGNLWVSTGPDGTVVRRIDTHDRAGASPFALAPVAEGSDENRDFLTSHDGHRVAIAQWNTEEASRATTFDPVGGGAPVTIAQPIPPGGFQHGSRLSGDGRYLLDIASTGPRVLDARDGRVVREWRLGAGAFAESKPGELNMRAVDCMMHKRGGGAMGVSGRSGPDEIDADISADGALVVVGAGDKLALLDVATGAASDVATPVAAHYAPVFDPTGRTFAAVATSTKAGTHHERGVFRYDVAARRPLPSIAIPAPAIALAWSADGRRLLTRTDRGTLDVWDAATQKHLLAVGDARAYAASADGERVAVATGDGLAISVWEVATARQIAHLPVGRAVEELAFSGDGTRLLSMVHGQANLWDVHLEVRAADLLAPAIAQVLAMAARRRRPRRSVIARSGAPPAPMPPHHAMTPAPAGSDAPPQLQRSVFGMSTR